MSGLVIALQYALRVTCTIFGRLCKLSYVSITKMSIIQFKYNSQDVVSSQRTGHQQPVLRASAIVDHSVDNCSLSFKDASFSIQYRINNEG